MTHAYLRAGLDAEQIIWSQFEEVGWRTRKTPGLDYTQGIDLAAVCPGLGYWPVQVSIHPKSKGERQKLIEKGVTPIAVSDLTRQKLTAPERICSACRRLLCASRLVDFRLSDD